MKELNIDIYEKKVGVIRLTFLEGRKRETTRLFNKEEDDKE